MSGKLKILGYFVFLCSLASMANADRLPVADFSISSIEGWDEKAFTGRTSYQLFQLKDKKVLMAESQICASGLIKKVQVDIRKYPYLNWSWRIENRLDIENEKIKSGDDYAARIYVVVNAGMLPWRTRAVSYVWANGAREGETWQNAFLGKNALMMAIKSRRDKISTWYSEKRNVYEDLKRLLGAEFEFIAAIGLMTDTDNSRGQVKAYYGDIFFSEN